MEFFLFAISFRLYLRPTHPIQKVPGPLPRG